MTEQPNSRAAQVGDLVRQLREAQGLQKKQLAEMCGIAPSTLVRLERGDYLPQTETLIQIAETLDVEYEDLAELVGFDAAKALPEPAIYFRTKYGQQLTDEQAAKMTADFNRIARKYGFDPTKPGPAPGEDE